MSRTHPLTPICESVMRSALLLMSVLLTATVAADDPPLAFVGAKIIPVRGEPIDQGTMIVRGATIEAIGKSKDVTIPDGAKEIDALGKVIMPGMVCTHSHIGGGAAADGSGPIQPGVRNSRLGQRS